MSDPDIPADLVGLKAQFLTAEAELAAYAATLPSSVDVVAETAEITDEQRATWQRLGNACTELAVQISRHPYLPSLPNPDRQKAAEAVTRAAKQLTPA